MTLDIVRQAGNRAYPPRETSFTRHFWRELGEGRLVTTRCEACSRLAFPPKPVCPHCWGASTVWVPLQASGKLYSSTVIHAGPAVFEHELPYSVGIVDLDEGLRLATRVIGAPSPDDRVELVVLAYDDGPLFAARAVNSAIGASMVCE